MFARRFLRGNATRRTIGIVGAFLALVGALLVFVSAFSASRSLTGGVILAVILGLAALFAARWIYRGSRAMFFGRVRLKTAGFLTAGIGVVLFVLGFGLEGLLVLGGGIVALLATVF